MKLFTRDEFPTTRFLFFTGKGGVGKTSTASTLSLVFANEGKRVLLISTDPASNLQDVFHQTLTNHPTLVSGTTNLYALNIDPIQAAQEYKERIVDPYRGKLPETVLRSMEEQMSGACTVEIAAFNEFSSLLTDKDIIEQYDLIVFDTAPTGHTLRLLQLPSAWSGFLGENTSGASCLGPLAGLESQKEMYREAVQVLSDPEKTTLVLIGRPEESPLKEAARASRELSEIGICNQILIVNGVFEGEISKDIYAETMFNRQQSSLNQMPSTLKQIPTFKLPIAPFGITNLESMERWFKHNWNFEEVSSDRSTIQYSNPNDLVEHYISNNHRIIFTMGKGGVGKTTIASLIALGLAAKGKKVHLTTTDPAAHLEWLQSDSDLCKNITTSKINPKQVVEDYRQEVLSKASEALDEEGLAFIKEDLESPCTEEIAVFRAFAEVAEKSNEEIVVIDTAPTGHTLLLLDASEAYHREISRSTGEIPESVSALLPKLRDSNHTSVVIVTLPEATPVLEAKRLEEDLVRAGIHPSFWVINQSFYITNTTDPILSRKAQDELEWIEAVRGFSNDRIVMIPWSIHEVKGSAGLCALLENE